MMPSASTGTPTTRIPQRGERRLLEEGLVDELHLLVHPVVVGHGKKLFTDGPKVPVKLVSATTFTNGVLHLVYAPTAD